MNRSIFAIVTAIALLSATNDSMMFAVMAAEGDLSRAASQSDTRVVVHSSSPLLARRVRRSCGKVRRFSRPRR